MANRHTLESVYFETLRIAGPVSDEAKRDMGYAATPEDFETSIKSPAQIDQPMDQISQSIRRHPAGGTHEGPSDWRLTDQEKSVGKAALKLVRKKLEK